MCTGKNKNSTLRSGGNGRYNNSQRKVNYIVLSSVFEVTTGSKLLVVMIIFSLSFDTKIRSIEVYKTSIYNLHLSLLVLLLLFFVRVHVLEKNYAIICKFSLHSLSVPFSYSVECYC